MEREQEVKSLTHRVEVLEGQAEEQDTVVQRAKQQELEGHAHTGNAVALTRKVAMLEDELDAAEKNAKETIEKYVLRGYARVDFVT